MKIGLFDHVEDGGRPLAKLYDERLQFAQAAEEAGSYCLHVAEHHATPLSLIPVPGVYLGALARATKTMRIGPLVYLLPVYTPLRLIEEISMLDHLSHGRLDVGVGRGVSPHELRFHKVAFDYSREIFVDAFKCINAGLATDTLTYKSKHFSYENVPIALRPLQQPLPPFWYASTNTEGATWAGENGLHFVTLGPVKMAKVAIDAYRAALAKRGGAAQPKPEFPGGAAIGILRMIIVAESDAEARQARQHRGPAPAVRRRLRCVARQRHRHRRHAGQSARGDRAADGRARRQLSSELPFLRHYAACRRAALAQFVQHRGDAAFGEAVSVTARNHSPRS